MSVNTPSPQRLAIAGAGGKMGKMLLEAAATDDAVTVVAQCHRGADDATLSAALADADCLIEFTRPEATAQYLRACVTAKCNLVIGTTGLPESMLADIKRAAERIGIVVAPNMSLGVNVTLKLVEQAARSLGMAADIEVFEAHHKMKVDAPSGTALKLGEVAAIARGQMFGDVAVLDRSAGRAGPRSPGEIGFSVLRAGDIIGDHTVTFALGGERIEITHRSSSRATYAHGAIHAAKFLAGKRAGLFDMQDVLGLR